MTSLNLLDTDRKRALKDHALLRTSIRTALVIVSVCVASIGSLLAISMSMSKKAADTEAELNRTRVISPSGNALPVAETTRRINQRLGILGAILDDPHLLPYVEAIVAALPIDAELSNLQISSTDKTISAQGVVATRNDIPTLQEKLDSLPLVKSPVIRSDINDRINVEFELTAGLVIVKKQP